MAQPFTPTTSPSDTLLSYNNLSHPPVDAAPWNSTVTSTVTNPSTTIQDFSKSDLDCSDFDEQWPSEFINEESSKSLQTHTTLTGQTTHVPIRSSKDTPKVITPAESIDSQSSLNRKPGRQFSATSPIQDPSDFTAIKRRRNTLAARKYRQKRLDRITELEEALAKVEADRDEWKMKATRWESEALLLRRLYEKKSL